MEMRWSDKIGSRGRRPWLLLVDAKGTVHEFVGRTVPGLVAVVGTDYEKCGKWSHTTYRLLLAPGVRHIAGRNGWETGRFSEGLGDATGVNPVDQWVDAANALGVTLAEAQRFIRAARPRAAEQFDQVDADLEAVDTEASNDGAEIVTINFGSPSNRQRAEGFWSRPVRVVSAEGREIGRVTPGGTCESWTTPCTHGPVRVLVAEHVRGYHGGTVSLRLAVPAGCRLER